MFDVFAFITLGRRIEHIAMAIKLDEITTDITLEIDEDDISLADYQKATDSFLNLIKEVSKQQSINNKNSDWSVKVYSGSAGLGVMGRGGIDVDAVRQDVISGLKLLGKGIRPGTFTDKAIEHAKSLALLFKKTVQPNVRIWSGREESVQMDRNIAAQATTLLGPAYEEYGAIEGILEKVDAHGGYKFVVYDVIDERAVRCEVSEADIPFALENFRQRVEVIGRVKYRKDGMPVAIKASRIISFPKPSEIPTLLDMRKILGGNTA